MSAPPPVPTPGTSETPPPTTGPLDLSSMQAWLDQIKAFGAGYELTDDDILNLGNFQLLSTIYQQYQDNQYRTDYMDFLGSQVQLNNRQLDLANKQLEWQQGEYWDFYKNQFFPAMQEQSRNELEMSKNQLGVSGNQLGISANELLSSANAVDQSRNYARAQAFNTKGAEYGADAARYEYLARTGQINVPRSKAIAFGY